MFLLIIFLFSIGLSEPKNLQEQAVINSRKIVLIRKELSPQAEVVTQARYEDRFDIVSKGKLYVKIRTENGDEGWLSLNDCRIVEKGAGLKSESSHTIGFIIILIVSIAVGIFFFIRQQRGAEDTI